MFGIALIDSYPFRIDCRVQVKPGDGSIYIVGPVGPEIEEIVNNALRFAFELAELESYSAPDPSHQTIHIAVTTPKHDAPVFGPSYGLLVSLQLIRGILRFPDSKIAVTGAIDEDGVIHDVGMIAAKRKAAAEFGAPAIMLPYSQLDFFSHDIAQIPVRNIFQAYTAVVYGKTKC